MEHSEVLEYSRIVVSNPEYIYQILFWKNLLGAKWACTEV